MNKTVQDRKEEWERKRVQRVLDCHNEKYSTHVTIKGRSIEVYPQLKGQGDWDWVCYDTETGDGIAIEVKRLTDEQLEGRQNMLWQLLVEVGDSLSGKLPGTFHLAIDIPPYYHLSLGHHDKQQFKKVLYEAIIQIAPTLKLGEDRGLTPQISGNLPFALPDSFFCDLGKASDEGSALHKSSGVTGVWSRQLNEHELKKFEKLVSHANKQLRKANVKETFLVIIDEGRRITDPGTIPDAFKSISHNSYSHVGHAYCVSHEGEGGVTEIPLPTP